MANGCGGLLLQKKERYNKGVFFPGGKAAPFPKEGGEKMKERPYLAHRAKDGREQTVLEHLTGTADLCGRFEIGRAHV